MCLCGKEKKITKKLTLIQNNLTFDHYIVVLMFIK
jgi:hypothetical protein